MDLFPEGNRLIGDSTYAGEPDYFSYFPNSQDCPELFKFKSRVRLRHETVNTRFKAFKCLDSRFRHGREKHQLCVEAVAVILQYQFEVGLTLFDV